MENDKIVIESNTVINHIEKGLLAINMELETILAMLSKSLTYENMVEYYTKFNLKNTIEKNEIESSDRFIKRYNMVLESKFKTMNLLSKIKIIINLYENPLFSEKFSKQFSEEIFESLINDLNDI